ncbi:RNA polymerase II degradation factor 1-like [Cyclospora cayetanensis]|uniref:RNA polymerase II degradation factor 1-like n=1 Tax=Cyclospora cayetanensis TaxID=88456 RepID=A0A6P6RTW8_9EIME|nr:RNA polymerase II degradation factor 1-like [Cyclospora cayetanensis]
MGEGAVCFAAVWMCFCGGAAGAMGLCTAAGAASPARRGGSTPEARKNKVGGLLFRAAAPCSPASPAAVACAAPSAPHEGARTEAAISRANPMASRDPKKVASDVQGLQSTALAKAAEAETPSAAASPSGGMGKETDSGREAAATATTEAAAEAAAGERKQQQKQQQQQQRQQQQQQQRMRAPWNR